MRRTLLLVGTSWLCINLCLTGRGEDCLCEQPTNLAQSAPCDECGCPCDVPECCDCFNDRQRLLGMLPSDHCFDRFISPLSNPFFFEDPRSLTEARGIFVDNRVPDSIGGGDVQVFAAQFRGRLTDRWSVIAPRLGYVQLTPGGNGAPRGFLSAPIGVKYNFIRDVEEQSLVSAGMTYFIPGAPQAYSSFGNGDFHFFLTTGKEIFDEGHWLSATGFRIPANSNWGTQLWYWSNQWDYELPNHIYPLVGVNWFHWMRSAGNTIGAPVAGLDLINLPNGGIAGANVVSAVIGGKWKPSGNFEVGGGFEFSMSNYTDILQNRVYADVIFRY